jgi:hypothetical protein
MARTTYNGNGHDPRHATETPDVSHIKNLDVTHEASDVSVSGVAKFVLGLTVLGIVVFVLMWGMFGFFNAQEETREPPPGPMAMSAEERLPPEPRLQTARGFNVKLGSGEVVDLENKAPDAEYRVLREQWERQLNCKRDSSVASSGHAETVASEAPQNPQPGCVSIEEAIQKFVASAPPSRVKKSAEEGAGWRAQDYGIDPPTAASSGRTTEKGK